VSDTQTRLDAIRARLADATMADNLAVEYFEDVPWLAAELERVTAALRDAAETASHLLDMIPRQVWLDTGGDDGQGHYEGDYRAAKVAEDIAGWAAIAGGARAAQEGDV
jgi:hypothetical protein